MIVFVVFEVLISWLFQARI